MEKHLSEMSLAELTAEEGIRCSCGKVHRCGLRFFRAGPGAVNTLPEALKYAALRRFISLDMVDIIRIRLEDRGIIDR